MRSSEVRTLPPTSFLFHPQTFFFTHAFINCLIGSEGATIPSEVAKRVAAVRGLNELYQFAKIGAYFDSNHKVPISKSIYIVCPCTPRLTQGSESTQNDRSADISRLSEAALQCVHSTNVDELSKQPSTSQSHRLLHECSSNSLVHAREWSHLMITTIYRLCGYFPPSSQNMRVTDMAADFRELLQFTASNNHQYWTVLVLDRVESVRSRRLVEADRGITKRI